MTRPFWNPYAAGIGLGLTLLFSYIVLGTGLGASGGITRIAASAAHAVAPSAVEGNDYLNGYFANGSPLAYYLVTMLVGTLLGGFLSAYNAGRVQLGIERGPRHHRACASPGADRRRTRRPRRALRVGLHLGPGPVGWCHAADR
jgi:hypothetical protein